MMKAFILAFLTMAAPALSQAKLEVDQPRNENFCVDELEDLLREVYGPEAKIVGKSISPGQGENWTLWVRTNLCKGSIGARFFGERWVCRQHAYGTRARILINAFGYGECEELIGGNLNWASARGGIVRK